MAAQFVKTFRKSNKNDYLEAEAIAEAVQRPTMRFVPIKTDDQLDLQALHRVRDRWVARRTAVMNQIRGFLIERGITIRKDPSHLTTQLRGILEDADSLLSGRLRLLILDLKHEWNELDKRIENSNAELQRIAKQDDACHRLMEIPGFGPLVSTALVAAIGNGITFRKGRELSAWLSQTGSLDEGVSTEAKALRTIRDFGNYIADNQAFIPDYGDRHRNGERISSAFAESAVNQLVSRRMIKHQQMHWTKRGAHLLLQVRAQVMNGDLRQTFRRWYPGMNAASEDSLSRAA